MLSSTRSGDLGIEVKCQSSQAIAGSSRNGPQSSLAGGRLWGRALIGRSGGEIPHRPVKLRTCSRRRKLETGLGGKPLTRRGNNPDYG